MDTLATASPLSSAASAARVMNDALGRVVAVTGSTATVELTARLATAADSPTVGKFMGITTPKALIIGLVTEVGEQALGQVASRADFRKVARLDLIGEVVGGKFSRGVTDYPTIGDATIEEVSRWLCDRGTAVRVEVAGVPLQVRPERVHPGGTW